MNRFPAFLLILLMLGACVKTQQKPAPVTLYGTSSGAGSAGVHAVAGNETLWNISQRYQLSMRDIAAANNLGPPFDLKPGQRLRLPPPREYVVRTGDDLYTVSRLFNVGTSDIAQLNHILPPYKLMAGEKLRVPTLTRDTEPAPVILSQTEKLIQPMQSREPVSSSIIPHPPAARVPPSPLRERVSEPKAKTGEGLQKMSPPSAPVAYGSPPHVLQLPPGYQDPKIGPAVSQPPQPLQVVQAPEPPAKKTPITAQVPKRASSKFLQPVQGKIISEYGPKKDGLHNDGINIAAVEGTPVKAADNGVVVYAGNELKGSGNLIIIRHQDRWMTAYAHMGQVAIKRGDTVKRGQTIGTVGSTGSVDKPQLHFEVRRGTEAINPKLYLES